MILRKTLPAEALRVNQLFAIAFESPLQNCPADPENDSATHWAAYTDGGEMMSTLTISDYQIRFDGHVCRMGGVGGVATLPQYRRMGGIRGCFEAALPNMYENGCDFSYLYPFSTTYYRKFGYESCVQKYQAVVSLGLWSVPALAGTLRLAEHGHNMTGDIRRLDRLWEGHFNMMVQHRPEDYGWAEKADPAAKQEFTYLWYDATGMPKGCTTFRKEDQPDGRNLVCSRFCFADKEGFYGLMGLFKSLSADHSYVKFSLPVTSAVQYLAPEWSLGAVRWELRAGGMVRVINVKRVLEKARYLGSGAAVLQIRDSQIPENNSRFAVQFSEGKAVSVTRSEEAPDISLDISTFSALIAGAADFADAKYTLSGMEIHQENPCLGQIFYRKPLYITDYF